MSISIGSGLYEIYTMTTGAKGAINLDGHRSKLHAIDHLIRSVLGDGYNDLEAAKRTVREVVEAALKHCDEDDKDPCTCETGESCELHPDEDEPT